MAKKNKAGVVSSGKVGKVKAAGKVTLAKAKRPARQKKATIEKIEPEVATTPAPAFDPTADQIQMRAYFISERRRRFDLPGDANSDWLEAKRQLLAETRH